MNVNRNRFFEMLLSGAALLSCLGVVSAQQKPAPADSGTIIRAETKVVLVDAVVTDKKGNYLRDLTAKDFKVWEDNKEQNITSFTFEADPSSPSNAHPRYIVLFFDNSTMSPGSQAQARDAAAKFIDSNSGPNRLMAVVNFGGSLQIAQNFSSDVERLKNAVKGLRNSTVSPNGSGGVQLGAEAANFGARTVVLAIRNLAKNLAAIPGRKSLILFTGGMPVTQEILSELTATISTCNRSNVAIYPIDVRGLTTPVVTPRSPLGELLGHGGDRHIVQAVSYRKAIFIPGALAFFLPPQVRVPGGGGSPQPPSPKPSPSPTPPPTGRNPPPPSSNPPPPNPGPRPAPGVAPPFNRPNGLVPKLPESANTNQNIMYMLAEGTGGFVIVNTNDLFGGLEKIGKELNEYYLLGYTPPESEDGSCHTLKVKVEHGASVRARTGYCNARSKDALAQSPIEKVLEVRAAAQGAGNVAASLQAPYFYTSDNVARVNVAMEISPASFQFDKEKGKFRSVVNVLGIANRPDGSVGARFSDVVKLEFDDKKQMEAFKSGSYHYENQFDIASGDYTLKIVFISGKENFGKLETALKVDPYDVKKFTVSPIAFSRHIRDVTKMDVNMDAALIEDRTPLVSDGFQIIPSGSNKFKTSDKAVMYLEVYEPLLVAADTAKTVAVALQVRVLDGKTGEKKSDTGPFRIAVPDKPGAPAIPLGLQIEVGKLTPGSYRLELSAMDSAGGKAQRLTDFVIE